MYAGLFGLFFVVGIASVIGGLVAGLPPVAAVGVLFLVIAIQQGFLLLFRTASELGLDEDQQRLTWRATFAWGSTPVTNVQSIVQTSRPAVYAIRCSDGESIQFWLQNRGDSVQRFFSTLLTANPRIDASALRRRGRLWWRGLPLPG